MSLERFALLSGLPQYEYHVCNLIIDVVVNRDIQGLMEFTLSDLYDHKSRIQKHSDVKDIKALIRDRVYSLRDNHKQLKDTVESGRFRLVDGQLLFLHVKLRKAEMELAKSKQRIVELEKQVSQYNS